MDVSQEMAFIRSRLKEEIEVVYQYARFNEATGGMEFNVTYIVLRSNRLVEAG